MASCTGFPERGKVVFGGGALVVKAFESGGSEDAPGQGGAFEVRPLSPVDTLASARLHREALGAEFLSQAGEPFLNLYHLAWLQSPAGLALVAVSSKGEVVGVLLGALEPALHYRSMARRHGLGMALRLLQHAAANPAFAYELLVTRAVRYARGAVRVLARGEGAARATRPETKEGEITHLVVAPAARRMGIARALVGEALRVAEAAGLDQVVLVTPPELASSGFYLRLGWQPYGEVTSRSGEHFVRYRWVLARDANAPGRECDPAR